MRIDPLMLYGTDCLKAASSPADADLEQCRTWLTREIHITQPRIVVAMGDDARAFLDSIEFPLSVPCEAPAGEIQRWTPTIELLALPDIDQLPRRARRRSSSSGTAFKVLGDLVREPPALLTAERLVPDPVFAPGLSLHLRAMTPELRILRRWL